MKTATILLVLCGSLLFAAGLLAEDESSADLKAAQMSELIDAQIHNDMFYSTDNFFEQHRDIPYSDITTPSGRTFAQEKEIETLLSAGDTHLEAGEYAKAWAIHSGLLARDSEYVVAHAVELLQAGDAYGSDGHHDEALAICGSILAHDADNAAAQSLQGSVEALVAAIEAARLAAEQQAAAAVLALAQARAARARAEQQAAAVAVAAAEPPVDPVDPPEPPPCYTPS